ncbi:MAG TPA: alginate export family protein [Lysobacter sp.]|nr:alginate export family protein [Lysobacter sp.]
MEQFGNPPLRRPLLACCGAVGLLIAVPQVQAADISSPQEAATRPAIKTNRWQEDWSALAEPSLRTHPLDTIKYLPLRRNDARSYLSLGLNWRARLETNDAPAFGTSGSAEDTYLLQRLQVHADLHFNSRWRLFTQIEDVRSVGKQAPSMTDRNPLDLRLAFVSYTAALNGGVLMARVGRQDFAFDQQRFLSLRDGPNVRQSFDAVWLHYERGSWEVSGFLSQPVQYASRESFDDVSNQHLRFHLLRIERHGPGDRSLSAYYARSDADDASYGDETGQERRDSLAMRVAGSAAQWDWDAEGMIQGGDVGNADVHAWAVGTRVGYTFADTTWRPRLGLQMDAASGDSRRDDGRLETFNPLFSNGTYNFSLAGYTGYVNLIHLKPSLTVKPSHDLKVSAALGLLWRQTTADAVYVQPDVAIAGTAGQGRRRTGTYAQLRTDWVLRPNLGAAIELVHYGVEQALRSAGAHDSNYAGAELKFAW